MTLHGQHVALEGAHGHQHGVVALREQRLDVLHALVALELDARLGVIGLADLEDGRDLAVDDLVGQAVGGDAVAHLAADLGVCLKDVDLVALLGEEERCGETARACADHCDLLAREGLVAHAALPLAGVAHRGGTLQAADGERLLQVVALALTLAVVGADVAEALGERHLLAHDGGCLLPLTGLDVTQVARDVDVRGATAAARDDVVLAAAVLLDETDHVHDGAGGAHLDAGTAETAAGLLQGGAIDGHAHRAVLGTMEADGANATQLLACADAAAAADAAGESVADQRVGGIGGYRTTLAAPALRRDAHVLVHGLQLADTVLGATGAVGGMGCQNQLHRQAAQLVGSITLGVDDHALGGLGHAGADGLVLALHLDHAETASPDGLKVGMSAQMRYEDASIECRVEN